MAQIRLFGSRRSSYVLLVLAVVVLTLAQLAASRAAARAAACVTWPRGVSPGTSLQAAIDANVCVKVETGTYTLAASLLLPAQHTLTGAGAGTTILQANLTTWNSNGYEGVVNVTDDSANATISNLTLDANGTATDAVVAHGMTITGTVLAKARCDGVGISGANVSVTNSTITGNGFSCPVAPPSAGIYVEGSQSYPGVGRHLNPVIDNNRIRDNGGPALDVNGAYGGRFTGNTVSGNGGWAAVSLYGASTWAVSGNMISQPSTTMIQPYHPYCGQGLPAGAHDAALLICQDADDDDGLVAQHDSVTDNTVSGYYGLVLIGNDESNWLWVPRMNTLTGNVVTSSTVGCADDYPAKRSDSNTWSNNTGRSGTRCTPVYF